MTESNQPQRQHNSQPQAIADVLAALDISVIEHSNGEFRFLGDPPNWLLQLAPEALSGASFDLTGRFPFLEVFLPEAEKHWAGQSTESTISDLWTETMPDGTNLHLQARASRQNLLVIYRADPVYGVQKQLQQYAHEIELLNREVERANRAKSDFLANMSHEIRTPMNAILGMAELLGETELTPDQRHYVDTFQRAGSSLLNIINDILDLSKVESGHITLERIPFDLHDVVARAVELIRIKASEKGLDVTSEIEPRVPRYLTGDPTRVRQVIINLLGNSLKFTEKGTLTVRVGLDSRTNDGVTLRVAISDTGIGIPADKLNRIFDSFSQADSSTARKYGGTGLGLSISKKFVELMHGRIWVESIVGQGSTFLFTADFGIADQPVAAEPARAEQKQVPACRILLADDSEDNRFLIRAYLKNSPVTLDFAENGEIALQKLTSGQYDLVLMDVHMPVMDGHAATSKFRDFERRNYRTPLPVLALTADAFQDAIDKSLATGFTAHLTKPIRKTTLLDAIARYAQSGQPSDEITVHVDAAIADIIPKFLDNIRRNPETICKAIDAGDLQTARTLGHNMRGTGSAYGFPPITDLGAQIEQAAKDGNCDIIRSKASELASYLERLKVEYS